MKIGRLLCGLFATAGFYLPLLAAPPNTVTLDGRPIEYDAGELRGTNPQTNTNFGVGNVITNLYVTWDADYIYFALQGWEVNDKLTIMMDVDPGYSRGATTTTNWSTNSAPYIAYNDVGWSSGDPAAFALDYQIASEGFYNNIVRVRYNGVDQPGTNNVDALFDVGNGATPAGTPVDMVVLANANNDPLKGFEARIPWSVLYTNDLFGTVEAGKSVPAGAIIRVFAVLHNNDPVSSYSSDGIIPNQSNPANLVAGVWTTTDYIDILIDLDTNGLPDVLTGDVNAPYINILSGVQAKRQVYASFNEPVNATDASNPANWLVNEQAISGVTLVATNAVLLALTNDLPAAGTLVRVQASGVQDPSGNARTTFLYFSPAASGIETSVTVRFLLNKNSGFGANAANPRATSNFFVNGSAGPLEWGYPPAVSAPLSSLNATQYFRDVTFPPGTPTAISYKYSGILDGGTEATGINNYEAIRFSGFGDAARILTLPLDGSSLVVTDYLGAAAAPLRVPGNVTNETALYSDTRRADAGVRQNAQVLFRLDLSQRNIGGVTRVMLLGSDPLRGFNNHPDYFGGFTGLSDYPGSVDVAWDVGGLEMFDNGTNGDDVAGDGIYARLCDFTTDGLASGISLVGGDGFTAPYLGGWVDGRSPRSFDYKFAIYKAGTTASLISPEGANLTYYLGASETNATMPTHLWANEGLPPPPPTNSPTMISIQFTNNQRIINFEGTDLSHGVRISTNLRSGWMDFGHRAVTSTTPGMWRATISDVQNVEHYLAFSGEAKPYRGIWVEPNPLPETGGVLNVYYKQHSRPLAGYRSGIFLKGSFNGWSPTTPMSYLGDGLWAGSVEIPGTAANPIEFKVNHDANNIWEGTGWGPGGNVAAYRGSLRATWTPMMPAPGEVVTITYDAAGGPLVTATQIFAHSGFTEVWNGVSERPMTNISGTVWELGLEVPTNAHTSINMVFNNGSVWDSEGNGGRYWRIYIRDP